MSKHGKGHRFVVRSSNQKNKKALERDDLVDLVLGPLADQIDRVRFEILASIQKVNESSDIIAQELARRAKQGE